MAAEGQVLSGESLLIRYVNFVKLPHTLFALPFAFLGVLAASRQAPVGFRTVLLVAIAFTAARWVAMGFNRIADRRYDAANPRTQLRELPQGKLSLVQAWISVILAAVIFIAAAGLLSPLCLLLSPLALAWAYPAHGLRPHGLFADVAGADPAGQATIPYRGESSLPQPFHQRVGFGKRQHGLWKVGVGGHMFRDETPDQGQKASEIEEIEGPQRLARGRAELEDHQTGPRFEHPCGLAQAGIEIGQVADPEPDHGTIEAVGGKRQGEGVSGNRSRPGRLILAEYQHGVNEVSGHDLTREPATAGERGCEIHGAAAQIQVPTPGCAFPAELAKRGPAPEAIDIEAEEMVEKVIPGSDRREHLADVRPFPAPLALLLAPHAPVRPSLGGQHSAAM